jgi:hypothetical protein
MAMSVGASQNRFSVRGEQVLLNGHTFKVIGLRTSNALISDRTPQELIDNLDAFKSHGVNTVSVFVMGSRFGDVKGYRPDATLDPKYAERLGRIIKAADQRGMVVLVGCLYWSNSRAKDDLDGHWTQKEANAAVANTVAWLRENDHRNVFVDVDNEGMAHGSKGWSIAEMIDAAHAVDPTIMVGYNCRKPPPANADLLLHHSPRAKGRPWIESEGTPSNAPGGYWGSYSKQRNYYNYRRIGRYTKAMKENQFRHTRDGIEGQAGYMMASTWLQCAPSEGVGGPFMRPGGRAESEAIDADVTKLQPDAGIRWWLEYVRKQYGAWTPPEVP